MSKSIAKKIWAINDPIGGFATFGMKQKDSEKKKKKKKKSQKIAKEKDEFEKSTLPGGRSLREGDPVGTILGGRPGGVPGAGSVLGR